MKNILLGVLFAFLFLIPSRVGAQAPTPTCTPVYGGGQACPDTQQQTPSTPQTSTFTVAKFVLVPGKGGEFVENLTTNGTKYQPGDQIIFRITLTNRGTASIPHVDLIDTLPSQLDLITGQGQYDPNRRVLTIGIDNLASNESQTYTLTTQAVSRDKFPNDKGTSCVINNVRATASTGLSATDSSQVCIERVNALTNPAPTTPSSLAPTRIQVKPQPTKTPLSVLPQPPVSKSPPTGPEMLVLPLLGATGAVGFYLRRKTS